MFIIGQSVAGEAANFGQWFTPVIDADGSVVACGCGASVLVSSVRARFISDALNAVEAACDPVPGFDLSALPAFAIG